MSGPPSVQYTFLAGKASCTRDMAEGAPPQVVIVIEHPYLCGQAGLAQHRAKEAFYELNFLFLRPKAGGHVSFLLGIRFVLHRDGVDDNALGLVALKELLEVTRVRIEAELAHRSADHGLVRLHPSRRAPR